MVDTNARLLALSKQGKVNEVVNITPTLGEGIINVNSGSQYYNLDFENQSNITVKLNIDFLPNNEFTFYLYMHINNTTVPSVTIQLLKNNIEQNIRYVDDFSIDFNETDNLFAFQYTTSQGWVANQCYCLEISE